MAISSDLDEERDRPGSTPLSDRASGFKQRYQGNCISIANRLSQMAGHLPTSTPSGSPSIMTAAMHHYHPGSKPRLREPEYLAAGGGFLASTR